MAHGVLAFRRQCFAMVSILSLLLCVAIIVLWVRSYWVWDLLDYSNGHGSYVSISSRAGYMSAVSADLAFPVPRSYVLRHIPMGTGDAQSGAFRFQAQFKTGASWNAFPHWSLALLFAIVPAFWFRSLVRARRAAGKGICPHCGYDLRATPNRCPECGRESGQ